MIILTDKKSNTFNGKCKINFNIKKKLAKIEEENLSDITKGDRIMEEYVKESIKASMDEEVIGLYDKELHLEKLRLSELKEAREKGIEQGIEKGIEKGIEQEKIEIAKSMLSKNIDVSVISECTGLAKEEIEELI